MQKSENKGEKQSLNKVPYNFIAPIFLEDFALVLEFGAKKYEPYNWTKGLELEEISASIMRHLAQIRKGEFIDTETNLPHAAHIACNAMFISELHRMNKLDTTTLKHYESHPNV
jgi:hypothetical protein